jgi:hypothetical protein
MRLLVMQFLFLSILISTVQLGNCLYEYYAHPVVSTNATCYETKLHQSLCS